MNTFSGAVSYQGDTNSHEKMQFQFHGPSLGVSPHQLKYSLRSLEPLPIFNVWVNRQALWPGACAAGVCCGTFVMLKSF